MLKQRTATFYINSIPSVLYPHHFPSILNTNIIHQFIHFFFSQAVNFKNMRYQFQLDSLGIHFSVHYRKTINEIQGVYLHSHRRAKLTAALIIHSGFF